MGAAEVPPYVPEPYRIKAVEPIPEVPPETREARLEVAGYNLFQLRTADVIVDLLTDSGTGAMSDRQWAALMMGDEAYAGSRSFAALEQAVQEVLGFPHVIPTHQGRGAEHVLFQALVEPGDVVPSNWHFDTTRAHVLHRGARPLDLGCGEGRDPQNTAPFKGNLDVERLEAVLGDPAVRVPLVMCTVTSNANGGQPVSLENLRAAGAACKKRGVPFFLDACRFAENAWFIQQREPGQGARPIADIVRDMMAVADGCTMSGKKDALVNIGGFLAARDRELYRRAQTWAVLFEGFPTYGGLAGRDLEAMAVGLREVTDSRYLAHRTGQVAYLAGRLRAAGVPLVEPPGGHAVYLDAARVLPHVPPDEFPGHAVAVELYRLGAVRGVEVGTLMAGRDPATGKNVGAPMELVRLAIPRRTYTRAHLDVVTEAAAAIMARRDRLRGFAFVDEPPVLRHFTARFAPK